MICLISRAYLAVPREFRTFIYFLSYEVIYGIHIMVELWLVVTMKKKGHDYRVLLPLARDIFNGLVNFFRTLFDSMCLYIIGTRRQYCDISSRVFLMRTLIARTVRPGKTQPQASKPSPWTSGATTRTMELPMTVRDIPTTVCK